MKCTAVSLCLGHSRARPCLQNTTDSAVLMLLADLPREIHDKIAEHLQPPDFDDEDETEVRGLTDLALTCSSFRLPAQRALLSSIELTLPSDKLQRLLETLRSKPEYGHYVRSVAIEEIRPTIIQMYSQEMPLLARYLLARPQI
jgi:hypothetical protein